MHHWDGKKRHNKSGIDDDHGAWQKIQAVSAVVVVAIALLLVPTLAWLNYQRELQTVTMINRPNALMLGAGNVEAITKLELNDIDVSAEPRYKDVVFCVYGDQPVSYKIQLAHTTNIKFSYQIYPAQLGNGGTNKIEYLGKEYSFEANPAGDLGAYLNQDASSGLADSTLHDKTYANWDGTVGSYLNVQPNAEPLYWQNSTKLTLPNTTGEQGYHVDYYVLRIAWDETVQNNKETDMVYLMAESIP